MKCIVCGISGSSLYAVGSLSIGKHTVCSTCVTRIVEQHIDFHELDG